MKIRLLGSTIGQCDGRQFLSTLVVNDQVALDAGSLGYWCPLEQQTRVTDVFLSHSHIDHVGSLPVFTDNVYQTGRPHPRVYGSAAVIESLRRDFFNDRVWPDLERIGREVNMQFIELITIKSERSVQVAGLTITPCNINHVVPTMGFLLDDGDTTVAVISDTAETDRIWELAAKLPRLKAVFLECSFPNQLDWLASRAAHLTPATFRTEVAKLGRDLPLVAVHIKPAWHDQVVAELKDLKLAGLRIGEPDVVYEF